MSMTWGKVPVLKDTKLCIEKYISFYKSVIDVTNGKTQAVGDMDLVGLSLEDTQPVGI